MLRPDTQEHHWYAAHVFPRHEKSVAGQLSYRAIETFLPLYRATHKWKNGDAEVQLPFFPGYVFVRIALRERLRVIELPSIRRLVGIGNNPISLEDSLIDQLRWTVSTRYHFQPCPYVAVGDRVRVNRGPLEGLVGILLRLKTEDRVVLSVDIVKRSVAVEVDINDVEPLMAEKFSMTQFSGLPRVA